MVVEGIEKVFDSGAVIAGALVVTAPNKPGDANPLLLVVVATVLLWPNWKVLDGVLEVVVVGDVVVGGTEIGFDGWSETLVELEAVLNKVDGAVGCDSGDAIGGVAGFEKSVTSTGLPKANVVPTSTGAAGTVLTGFSTGIGADELKDVGVDVVDSATDTEGTPN